MSLANAIASLRYGDRIFVEYVDFAAEGASGEDDGAHETSKKPKKGKATWLIEGQGFFNDDLAVVSTPPPSADECLFQICPRSRVSAAEDFALQCTNRDGIRENHGIGWTDELQNQFDLAKKHADNEEAENNKAMQEKAGIEVVFGEIIQLKHCKTGKWMMVDKSKTAKVEQENIECTLSEIVSQQCWITIRPSKRFQFQGDEVCDKSIVFLCSENSKTSQAQFLHMAQHNFIDSNVLKSEAVKQRSQNMVKMELNSSLDATPWRIVRFDSDGGAPTSDTAEDIHLGDMVCIEATDAPQEQGAQLDTLDLNQTSYLGYYKWSPRKVAGNNGGAGGDAGGEANEAKVVTSSEENSEFKEKSKKLLFKPKSADLPDGVYPSDCYWIGKRRECVSATAVGLVSGESV
jgi:hypothetical protein